MKTLEYDPQRIDFYMDNDLSNLDAGDPVEDAMAKSHSEAEGKAVDKESLNQEREHQLEAWMMNIKAFIRSIDVSKL